MPTLPSWVRVAGRRPVPVVVDVVGRDRLQRGPQVDEAGHRDAGSRRPTIGPAYPPSRSPIHHMAAPTTPAAGSVSSQATTIRPATPQRTSAPRLAPRPVPIDRPGRHLRRGEREAEVARREDHRGRCALGGHALGRADLDQALAHRADDPPAADVGAERDRERAGDLDPERDRPGVGPVAARDQRQGDHAHRLLGVVGAVSQRDQRGAADLAPAEAGLGEALRDAGGDPVDQPGADAGDHARDER